MPRRWCLGVAVVVSTAIGGPPANAQEPPATDLQTPSVTVPPATVPQVTVPPVPAPVPTPEVTTPEVTTPSVTVPSVGGSGSGDSGTASGSGSGTASGSGSGGGSGSGTASGSGAGDGSGSGAASGSGAGDDSGSGAATDDGSSPSARARPRTSSSGDEPDAAASKARRRDRQLRRTVLGHAECLGQMPRAERRVLRLRAGVGIDRTRSRAEVERLTGLDRARVGALERRGLSRLRELVAAGRCGAGSGAADNATGTGASPSSTAGGGPQVVVRGERESGTARTPRASAAGSASRAEDDRPLLHAPDSARDLVPFLVALLLAGLVFVLVREGRRSA